MQTFLPYPDCIKTALVLDMKRLGKQRVEALQILKCLVVNKNRWWNHPAVRMWRGCETFLSYYGCCICQEWISRGYKDTCLQKIKTVIYPSQDYPPFWWGDDRLHSSHRARLLDKNFTWYSRFEWTEIPDKNYFWPK
jgi:hypothetical protein